MDKVHLDVLMDVFYPWCRAVFALDRRDFFFNCRLNIVKVLSIRGHSALNSKRNTSVTPSTTQKTWKGTRNSVTVGSVGKTKMSSRYDMAMTILNAQQLWPVALD